MRKTRPPMADRPKPCRFAAFDAYREQCAAQGASCSLSQACGQYGVGGQYWPINQLKLDDAQFKQVGPANVRNGRKCIENAMWNDTDFRTSVGLQCPSDDVVVDRLGRPMPGAFVPSSKRTARKSNRRF